MNTNEKLNLVCERLGITAENRPAVIESNTRFLVGNALESAADTGQPVAWIEAQREFTTWDEMADDLAVQAGDPDDPNPLPLFVIDLANEMDPDMPTIDGLVYNPVSGISDAGYATDISADEFDGDPLKVCSFVATACCF